MINYLSDVQPLESKLSDSEIAAHLSTRTVSPILVETAKDMLLESGVVLVSPVSGNRIGSLIDHYTSLPEGQDKILLAWFINHVFGDGLQVETDQYPRSIQFAAVEDGLPAEISPVASSIVNAAGGRPGAGTVAADVSTARELYLLEQQANQAMQDQEQKYVRLYNQNIAPLLDVNNADDAAWQTALANMASEWGA